MSETHQVVMATTGSAEAADELAASIVQAHLAACVQIMPIRSVYRWQGEVRKDAEWLCLVKTAADRVAELFEHIAARHDYDEPEIVAVPISSGSAGYLSWLTEQTRPKT